MPRSHLTALIIRLALGFVVLGVIAVLLFTRLRKPKTEPSPTAIPTTESPIAIISPSPLPTSPSGLPEIDGEDDTDTDHDDNASKGGISDEFVQRRIVKRTTVTTIIYDIAGNEVSRTISHHGGTNSTSTATGGQTSTSASSGSWGSNASASANGGASSASASASTR